MHRRTFLRSSLAAGLAGGAAAAEEEETANQYFELRFFRLRFSKAHQFERFTDFLETQHLPMLKRHEFGPTGYFQVHLGPDMPQIVILNVFNSLAEMEEKWAAKSNDKEWMKAANEFGAADDPPYERYQSWLLRAFGGMPRIEVPPKKQDSSPRLFDLRTYEAETPRDVREKISMFNQEEIAIFKKSGINPVFFGQALFGAKLPNLTYMVWYDDMRAREEAWSKFLADPDWKRISTKPEWANEEIVSNITNLFLRPLPFSPIR